MLDKYTIKDVIDEVIDYRGKTPKKLGGDWSEVKTDYMALSAKNIKKGRIVQPDTIRYVDQEMYNKWMKQEVERGTVLITSEAPFGELLYWDSNDKIVLSQRLFGLKIKKEFNSRYIYYYMFSEQFQGELSGRATGSTVIGLRQPELLKCHLKIPNRKYQDIIAAMLMNIDKKIDLNNEINNNLYEFNNKLFEEKILNIAEKDDWEEYLLSDISKMINGYSYKGNELVEKSNIGMATIKNFERTGGFKLDGFKDIVPQKCKSDHYVKPFEILVACTDLTQNADIIGNAIMLLNNANYDEIIMSMDLVKLIPITDIVNNYMLYAIVNSKDFKNFALRYKSGTTVLHLNKNCFKEYTIKLPNYNTIKDLSKVFEGNYKKISQIIDENRKLEQLRDTLLPKLMNGEIDLDNIEI